MFKYILAAIIIALVWAIVLVLHLPDWIAIVATVAIVGILATLFVVRRYRALKAARDIEKALAAQADEHARTVRPEQQAEIQAMQAEFQKAIGSLKTSKLGKVGAEALYSLPWYMIIGPPGTGKSTALRNSGLQFPYLSQAGGGVRGVGGTRNCEWWLTNEGVILDTAGRYTTEEDDKDEWLSFLDMLKRNRPRKPVNGIMVAVSVGDLGGAHEEDVVTLAKRIRERVDEVMGRLQMVVPVYLLFTKCDLIPGFVEMFGDLRKQERGQIWGFTVPLAQRVTSPGDLFAERFDELAKIVEQRALKRLPQERRIESREQIYAFPQQFEVLKHNMADFVGQLFQENVYQGSPIMRGVYFTSGTQEGRPIDRVMNSMAEAFGVRGRTNTGVNQVVEPKSYFLRDVFSNVVFPDQDVAARSQEEIRRERNRRYLIAAGAFAFAVLLSVLPAYAYFQNQALVRDADATATAVGQHHASGATGPIALETVERLRLQVERLGEASRHHPEVYMRLGMYQGDELYPPLRDLYTSTLRRDVIGPVVRHGVNDLNEFGRRYEAAQDARPSSDEHDRFYNELKLHLLLTAPRAANEPTLDAQRQWLSTQIVQRWAQMLHSADVGQNITMASNVGSYLNLAIENPRLAFDRDQDTVRRVRAALTRIPEISLALDQLIAEIEREGYGLTLASVLGTSGVLHGNGHVSGAFTRRGWEERVRDRLNTTLDTITGEAWVLGRDPNAGVAARREEQLRQLRSQYFSRYIAEWRAFLDSLRVDRPADLAAAQGMLEELTRGEPPPLGMLFRSVQYNTHLEEPQSNGANAAGGVLGAARTGIVARIRQRLGVNGAAAAGAAANALTADNQAAEERLYERDDVEAEFQGFFSFGAPPPPPPQAQGAPPPPPAATNLGLNVYQEQLAFLRDGLRTYTENTNAPTTPLLAALQTARTRVEALIATQEIGWRPRFQALLWPPIQFSVERITNALGGGTGMRWCTAVVVPFERTLHNRYPFDPAGQDAALADVADFYRPERGVLWTFYGTALHDDVPHVGEHFEFAQRLGSMANDVYLPELPRFLERSSDIATVLFPAGSNDPLVHFEVRVRPTPSIATVTFQVDGQSVEYHNGPEQWHTMRWPGEGAVHGASIRARGENGIDETIQQEGEWGLYRLLEAGIVHGDPAARIFSVVWTLRDQNIEIGVDIRPARSENPFLGIPRRNSNNALLQPFRETEDVAPHIIARGASDCELNTLPTGGHRPGTGSGHHHHHHHDNNVPVSRGPSRHRTAWARTAPAPAATVFA